MMGQYRKIRKTRTASAMTLKAEQMIAIDEMLTDDQVSENISKSFRVLEVLTKAAVQGQCRSLIVYGPAGLGKSYTVEKVLEDASVNHTIIKGGATKIGLLKTLYKYRAKGDVIVFDDCDSILLDLDCISLLKAACDTTEKRTVSYLSNDKIQPDGELGTIPSTWSFDGTVIFITNTNFENTAAKLQEHCNAMISRSHYIDLRMVTKRDYLIRIKQVVAQGLFGSMLTVDQISKVMDYIEVNVDTLRELSLRMALKIGQLCVDMDDWKDVADVTCKRRI